MRHRFNEMIVVAVFIFGILKGVVTAEGEDQEIHAIDDMELTPDQLKALTGNPSILPGDPYIDGDDGYMTFRWPNGSIPYLFENEDQFHTDLKAEILEAFELLNEKLDGCIKFR